MPNFKRKLSPVYKMGNVITRKSEKEHVRGLTQANLNQKKNILIAWPSESYPSVPFCNIKYSIKEKAAVVLYYFIRWNSIWVEMFILLTLSHKHFVSGLYKVLNKYLFIEEMNE